MDNVSVTQADREAAANYYYSAGGSPLIRDAIKRGERDNWFRVTAFARHRLASTQPAPAFPREEVERETQAVWRCGIGDVTGALDVLKNQWVNSRRKNEREAGATLAKVCDLIWAARGPAPSTYSEAATAGNQLIDRVKSALLQGKQP